MFQAAHLLPFQRLSNIFRLRQVAVLPRKPHSLAAMPVDKSSDLFI
jgi:hypothetical protein